MKKTTQKFNTLDSMLHQTLHTHKKQFYTVLAQRGVGFISSGSVLFWNSFYVVGKASNSFNFLVKLGHVAVQFIGVFGDFFVVLQYVNLCFSPVSVFLI